VQHTQRKSSHERNIVITRVSNQCSPFEERDWAGPDLDTLHRNQVIEFGKSVVSVAKLHVTLPSSMVFVATPGVENYGGMMHPLAKMHNLEHEYCSLCENGLAPCSSYFLGGGRGGGNLVCKHVGRLGAWGPTPG
jgi:hypothetical protein